MINKTWNHTIRVLNKSQAPLTLVKQIPNIWVNGSVDVKVTASAAEIDAWFDNNKLISDRTGRESVIGFDMEWLPGMNHKTALVQIATSTAALLIQMKYLNRIPDSLREVMQSPKIIKTGFEILADFTKLNRDYAISCNGFIDLGYVAKRLLNSPSRGLANVAQFVCGIEVPKPKTIQMGNWEVPILSDAQISYAAYDALIGKHVYDKIWNQFRRTRKSLLCCSEDFSYRSYYKSSSPSSQRQNSSNAVNDAVNNVPNSLEYVSICGGDELRTASVLAISSTSTLALRDFICMSDAKWLELAVSSGDSQKISNFWSRTLIRFCTRLGWNLYVPKLASDVKRENCYFISSANWLGYEEIFPNQPLVVSWAPDMLSLDEREKISKRILEYFIALQSRTPIDDLMICYTSRQAKMPQLFAQYLLAVRAGQPPIDVASLLGR